MARHRFRTEGRLQIFYLVICHRWPSKAAATPTPLPHPQKLTRLRRPVASLNTFDFGFNSVTAMKQRCAHSPVASTSALRSLRSLRETLLCGCHRGERVAQSPQSSQRGKALAGAHLGFIAIAELKPKSNVFRETMGRWVVEVAPAFGVRQRSRRSCRFGRPPMGDNHIECSKPPPPCESGGKPHALQNASELGMRSVRVMASGSVAAEFAEWVILLRCLGTAMKQKCAPVVAQ